MAQQVGNAWQVRGTLLQTQPGDPYALEVPVAVQTQQDAVSLVIRIAGPRTPFALQVDSRPWALHVDPQFDLFRLLDPRETPASIGQIFGEPQVLAVLPASADEATVQQYRDLMEAWKSDSHAIELVTDKELKSLPADRGVWMLGRENRWASGLLSRVGRAIAG